MLPDAIWLLYSHYGLQFTYSPIFQNWQGVIKCYLALQLRKPTTQKLRHNNQAIRWEHFFRKVKKKLGTVIFF
jgi:hypothetical protein